MSLEAKHVISNPVNKRFWDDTCRENEILAYMVANLTNEKVEFVPSFKT